MAPRRLLVPILMMAAAASAPCQQAALSFHPVEWEFGTISSDDPISLTLEVRNAGTASAEVTVIPTCDCLSVEPSRASLAPGSAAAFRLRFDPSDDDGEVRKDYVIRTSVPGVEKALFTVHGTVPGGRAAAGAAGGDGPPQTGEPEIRVDYYYTPGCARCERFLDATVPEVSRRIGARIAVERRDVLDAAVYARLAALAAELKTEIHAFPALLAGRRLLQGDGEIADGFESAARELLAAVRSGKDGTAPAGRETEGIIDRMAVLPVLLGGLLDGINPCAFTTLIFLLSYLTMAGRGRREILFIGLFFTLAVFLTYLLVGLGFFKALRAASAFPVVARALKWVLAAVLAAFAVLSVYDYALIRRGRASEMLLQLPSALKRRIHASIRSTARTAALAGSSLVLGFLVSLFEFACTGQVYLPTLAYMVRMKREASALLLLVLYNACFVLPLLLVFAAVYLGVGSRRISELFQRRMGAVKLGLALFFLGMAVFTLAV